VREAFAIGSGHSSLDSPFDNEDDGHAPGLIANEQTPSPDEKNRRLLLSNEINDLLNTLKSDEPEVLRLYTNRLRAQPQLEEMPQVQPHPGAHPPDQGAAPLKDSSTPLATPCSGNLFRDTLKPTSAHRSHFLVQAEMGRLVVRMSRRAGRARLPRCMLEPPTLLELA